MKGCMPSGNTFMWHVVNPLPPTQQHGTTIGTLESQAVSSPRVAPQMVPAVGFATRFLRPGGIYAVLTPQ